MVKLNRDENLVMIEDNPMAASTQAMGAKVNISLLKLEQFW
jgi:hypothetical protein